jgi:phosphohistidine phosphatase
MPHEGRTRRHLYLVRHAIADERGPAWPDDTTRPLTPKGADRMRQAVKGLRALGAQPHVVATSPLVRAEQTARILADGVKSQPDVVVVPALAPGNSPSAVAAALTAFTETSSVALVGHEPDLGRLAGWLMGTGAPPVFKKGGVCCLDVEGVPREGLATLVWMATPKMLRSLGS